MTEIGFDAASIGVMAAAYAALVPIIEIPSGILADRWSRRGVLVIAAVALALTSLDRRPQLQRPDLHRLRPRPRRLLRDVLRHDGRHRVRHGAGGDRCERGVRAADRSGAGRRERRPGGRRPGRRRGRRAHVAAAHLLPDGAVRGRSRCSRCSGSSSRSCTSSEEAHVASGADCTHVPAPSSGPLGWCRSSCSLCSTALLL